MSAPAAGRRSRPSTPRARRSAAWRSLVGGTGLLGRRRARRDAPLLTGWLALICVGAALSVAVPALVVDTVDRGAREAVSEVGSAADLVVRARIGESNVSADYSSLSDVADLAQSLPRALPDGLAHVAGAPSVSVLSPDIRLVRGVGSAEGPRVQGQFGLLGPDQEAGLTLVDGRLPAVAPEPAEIEAVISDTAAEVASLAVGSMVDATAPVTSAGGESAPVAVRIVGIVASTRSPSDTHSSSDTRCPAEWCDLPSMWAPTLRDSPGGETAGITLLVTAEGIAAAQPLFLDPFLASLRVPVRAERFTGDLVTAVVRETDALEANGAPLAEGSTATIDVRTDFPDALRPYGARAAASVAQMSLMIAGLFGAVAAVLLLVSALLVARRSADLALERARGASLGAVVVRGLAESVVLAAAGAGAGVALATLIAPGALADPLPLVAIVAVAVLAPPVQAVLVTREAWSGRRQPANRRDRQQIEGRAHVRRVVLELSLVLLAVAALVSVRSRGLVGAGADGTDPLLAAAPLLLAVAVTVVVVRVQPVLVRAATAVASRSRGAVGLLASAHAERSVAVLPLLALTLSVALVVGGSLVVQTVRDGQVDASWQRVGADARADGVFDRDSVGRAADAAGVTAAASLLSRGSVELDSGATSASATVVAVDPGFAGVTERLPAGDAPAPASLERLAAASAAPGVVPVLVDERLASRIDLDDLVMVFDDERVELDVVATFRGGPDGYLTGPFVFADLDVLGAALDEARDADTLLVMGPGAGAAATAAAAETAGATVITRTGWLDDRRGQALVQGVDRMTWLATAAVAFFAGIALLITVAAGGRSRSRSLSLLRTLGVNRRFGWVLAVAELAPLVVAALVGGAAAGIAILVVAGPALGLRLLAGGVGEPAIGVDGPTVAAVLVGSLALSAAAIVTDVVAHRRDSPGEVLRVGDTT